MNGSISRAGAQDLTGPNYIEVLRRYHHVLAPKTYLEIGTATGQSLQLASCSSIAIDPDFHINSAYIPGILSKPAAHFYQMGSDDFFARFNPVEILGSKLDLMFLDGMHRCEYLLRDFMNIERFSKPNSVVVLHDCVPVETGIASRVQSAATAEEIHRQGWWTGDVWRTALLLIRRRPDLSVVVLDAAPSGLVLITNLSPDTNRFDSSYIKMVEEMLSWDLQEIGISKIFSEFKLKPTHDFWEHDDITKYFWL